MTRPPAHRLLLALLAAACCIPALAPPAAAQGAGEVAGRRLLDLERRLLAEDVAELREARAAEAAAGQLVDDLIAALDAAVAAGAPAPALAGAEASAAEAAAALSAATHRAEGALASLAERLRRLRVLAAGAGAGGEEAVADLLTGRWAVEVEPSDVSGAFVLDQAGTLVTGSYQLDDGSRGSLEGTFVGDLVRLRRIDVASGFDSVFEARVGAAAQRMEGRWQATILGRGGAGGGEWVAVRVPAGAELVPEEEVEAGPDDRPAGPDPGTVAGPDPTTPVGTEDSPPAGPVDEEPLVEEEPVEEEPILDEELPIEEEPLEPEPADEPPLAAAASAHSGRSEEAA
jgi:hypothetical protein